MLPSNTRRNFIKTAAGGAAVSVVGLSGCVGGLGSFGEESGDFPSDGATINTYIPYGEGGGFDTVIRGLGPVLETAVAEQADVELDVVAENVTGGGGIRNYNEHSSRDPDGYHVSGIHGTAAPLNQIIGRDSVQYDILEFYHIGQVEQNVKVLVSRTENDQMAWDDISQQWEEDGLLMATSGTGSAEHIFGEHMASEADIDVEYVHYEGVNPALEGVVRGEADWTIANYSSGLPWAEEDDVTYHIGITDGEIPLDGPEILQASEEGLPAWERLRDLVNTVKTIALPPGVSDEVTSVWEDVLEQAVTSDEYQAFAEENSRPISYDANGNEIVQSIYDSQMEIESTLNEMFDA